MSYFSHRDSPQIRHLELTNFREPEEAHKRLQVTGPGVGGVFVTNALGYIVAKALNAEEENHTPIVGYDLLSQNAGCLRDGTMDFVIHQDPRRQGYNSVYALYRRVVLNETVEPRVRMPIDIVMKENLAFHIGAGEQVPEGAAHGCNNR